MQTLKDYMRKLEGLAIWHANNKKALVARQAEIKSLRERADALESSLSDLQVKLVNDNHLTAPLKASLAFFYSEGLESPEGFNCTFDRAYRKGFTGVRLNAHDAALMDMLAMGWADQLGVKGLVVHDIRLTPEGLEGLARALQIPKEPATPAPVEKVPLFKRR